MINQHTGYELGLPLEALLALHGPIHRIVSLWLATRWNT